MTRWRHATALLTLTVATAAAALTGCVPGPGTAATATPAASVALSSPPVPAGVPATTAPPAPAARADQVLRGEVSLPGVLRLVGAPGETRAGNVRGWYAALVSTDATATVTAVAERVRTGNTALGWSLTQTRTETGVRLAGTRAAAAAPAATAATAGGTEVDQGLGAGEHLLVDVTAGTGDSPVMVRVITTTVPAATTR